MKVCWNARPLLTLHIHRGAFSGVKSCWRKELTSWGSGLWEMVKQKSSGMDRGPTVVSLRFGHYNGLSNLGRWKRQLELGKLLLLVTWRCDQMYNTCHPYIHRGQLPRYYGPIMANSIQKLHMISWRKKQVVMKRRSGRVSGRGRSRLN